MKKSTKIIVSILLIAMMVFLATVPVFAADQLSPDKITATYDGDTSGMTTIAGKVVGLIRNIAVIAGVILLSVIGIKFMMGSAEEKAEYKKSLVPLVVGIVVVMAATQIATMIFSFFKA